MKILVSITIDDRSIREYYAKEQYSREYNSNIITKEIITDKSPVEYLTALYKLLCDNSKFIFIGDAIFNKDYIVNINAYEVVPNYNAGYTGARPVYER